MSSIEKYEKKLIEANRELYVSLVEAIMNAGGAVKNVHEMTVKDLFYIMAKNDITASFKYNGPREENDD